MTKLQIYYRQIAVLRCHKALILAKNVLYSQNRPMKMKNAATDVLPPPGSLIFRGYTQGL